ncbi:MAG: HAD-IB family hydrolase [Deltaproteobacteria bacterium]|nr:HAD-IB family hydrolase [Deltaproteobacteria bacterium]MBN2845728.1 HAD-IB family hydrolase [Deltaproteobacteria bacterium]
MRSKRIAAFFDFDKTLIEVESGRMAMKWMWDRRMILPGYMLKVLAARILNKLNLLSEERLIEIMLTFYRGRNLDNFRQGSEQFYQDYLKPSLAPAIIQRADFHKQEGHFLVLVSASIRYLLEPVVADLGFDLLLCTDLEEGEDGFLTGRSKGPVCIEENKRIITLKIAGEYGLDLENSYAYGDSKSDLPLLDLVGHPHVVEPSNALAKVAATRGWTVLTHR